jgi:hypothetical protein
MRSPPSLLLRTTSVLTAAVCCLDTSHQGAVRFASKIDLLKQLLQAPRLETREHAGKAMGVIVATALDADARYARTQEFIALLTSASTAHSGSVSMLSASASSNIVHGAIVAVGGM